eukprot:scaffold28899_cov68-Skeletonema_marinoi.AAC.1
MQDKVPSKHEPSTDILIKGRGCHVLRSQGQLVFRLRDRLVPVLHWRPLQVPKARAPHVDDAAVVWSYEF